MRRCVWLLALVMLSVACSDDAAEPTEPVPPPEAAVSTAAPATSEAAPEPSAAPGPVTSTEPPSTTTLSPTTTVPEYAEAREFMVDFQIEAREVSHQLVLGAMRAVPRHRFVPEEYLDQAYEDHPLPIGFGQTISQPYIVALMTEALGVEAGDRVLEIGTGSGYQAAVLAEMGITVHTIEIIPELAERATALLAELGYQNVSTLAADGYWGWDEHAPFDGIIVTAAPDHVPQPLVGQLAPGARMVIPVGPIGAVQTLWLFTADPAGELLAESLGPVRFVPFTRAEE